jgi:hypothetical protein
MDRTRSAELIPGSCAGHEADHVQDVGQGNPGPDFGEVDARHGGRIDRSIQEVPSRLDALWTLVTLDS